MVCDKKFIQKRALTVSEAATYACVSRGTIENWLTNRILPFEEFPGRGNGIQKFRRIRLSDLNKFLNSHYCESRQKNKTEKSESLILLKKDS